MEIAVWTDRGILVDLSSLLSAVVGLMTGAATGAATALGTGAGEAVSALVRERMARSEEGQAALARVEENPEDPASADALRSVLEREVAADPGFAFRLRQALTNTAHPPTGSVVIDRTTMRNSQIALGPLTVNNTRQARFSLAAAAVVLLVLVSLAGYGGVQILTGSAPSTSTPQVSSVPSTGILDGAPSPTGAGSPESTAQERAQRLPSGESDGSDSATWSCLDEHLSQEPEVYEFHRYQLPQGRTARNLSAGSAEQPTALLLKQDRKIVAAIRLYYESQGIGLDVLEVVDATCDRLDWKLSLTPRGGVVTLELDNRPYEVVIEASITTIDRATFQPAAD